VLTRLADAAGLTPEDVKHHAWEFGERLTQQRRELERAIDDGVRRATAQFKIPSRDELDAIREAFVARLEDHLFERMPGAPQHVHEAVARALATEAEAARVDPLLVLAMIEVESGYDSGATSHAGARGLMQLLPATMQREAEALGLCGASPDDPVANVRAGVRYLRRCLDAYRGQLDLALMAYNSGPNRVLEFLEDGEVPDWALVYPRRVEAEQRRIRKAFGEEAPARVATADRPRAR
jgi:soluble lytic murein transglycosylase-like protein